MLAAVRGETGVTVEDGDVLGGVRVQWVTPRGGVRGKEIVLYLFGGGFVC